MSASQLFEDVGASAHGPDVGAFFDLDRTLIQGYSAVWLLFERARSAAVTPGQLFEILLSTARWGAGRATLAQLLATTMSAAKGLEEETFWELGRRLFERHLARRIYQEAIDLIEAHRDAGHTLAIISSATPYQVLPTARAVDVPIYRCTRLAVEHGRFTGRLDGAPCCGDGKARAGEELADLYGLDLEKSFFYTDSLEDVPLLERVGRPRPVNASPALARFALSRGWPVARFGTRRGPVRGN